jgi:mannose-6-phosphate isomerase class I
MNKYRNNPYIDDNGKPKLLRSVICFADILGYKELMYSKNSVNERQELLDDLYNTFEETRKHLEESENTLELEFSGGFNS